MVTRGWQGIAVLVFSSNSLFSVSLDLSSGLEATDPRCPRLSCCEEVNAGGVVDPDCFPHALWTAAYCCARGPAADCYRWSEDSPGHDISTHLAVSGVQCRHLCQAHEACVLWTYLVDVPALPEDLRARCFLKSSSAAEHRLAAHPFAVSGNRFCGHFGEGLSKADARARRGLEIEVPWRTAAESNHLNSLGLYRLLPSAGTQRWHLDATTVFNELGFVVIVDALDALQTRSLYETAKRVAERMLSFDPHHIGNRGPRRYSFGAASRTLHMMHLQGWTELLDNGPVHAVLETIFSDGYLAAGGGGDFVLPDTSTYQSLHLDVGGGPIYELGHPPAVGVNFVVEDLTCADAPLRILPGSQKVVGEPWSLTVEPQDVKDAVLCPLPAGSAIIRDLRAWHGGTPSGSDKARFLPNAEFVSLAWGRLTCGTGEILDPCQPVVPRSAHERMSPRGRTVSAHIVDTSGVLDNPAFADVSTGTWLHEDFAHYERHQAGLY
eukprot:TRINITY_DN13643_c0_g1_i1.p1 TRINITY_DN13643_c0_g1~~TRINITY_DN13643_c0_g1_i1.p1  ORF type:complete len:493 (-),score=47.97 TRINITY_DN13643_c0_g1_i1:218-1696(-)